MLALPLQAAAQACLQSVPRQLAQAPSCMSLRCSQPVLLLALSGAPACRMFWMPPNSAAGPAANGQPLPPKLQELLAWLIQMWRACPSRPTLSLLCLLGPQRPQQAAPMPCAAQDVLSLAAQLLSAAPLAAEDLQLDS